MPKQATAIRLPKGLKQRVQRHAEKRETTVSELIRRTLDEKFPPETPKRNGKKRVA